MEVAGAAEMCSEPDVWIDGWKLAASSSRQADQVPAGHTARFFFYPHFFVFSSRFDAAGPPPHVCPPWTSAGI